MSTFTVTIELPTEFFVESRGVLYGAFRTTDYDESVIARAAMHGLNQKFGDALADPKIADRAERLANLHESLANGEWSKRRAGKSGMSESEDILWTVLESNVRAKVMAEKGYKKVKELTKADDAEIESRVDAAMAREDIRTNPGVVAACAAEKDRRVSARAAKSAAKELDI